MSNVLETTKKDPFGIEPERVFFEHLTKREALVRSYI